VVVDHLPEATDEPRYFLDDEHPIYVGNHEAQVQVGVLISRAATD
jgi:hypothetical protein